MSKKNLLKIIASTLRGAVRTGTRTPDFEKIFFTFSDFENFEQGTFKAIELFRFRFQRCC